MNRARKLWITLALATAVIGGVGAVTGTAYAQTEPSQVPNCTTWRWVETTEADQWARVPATSDGSLNCLLELGAENVAVRELQVTLNECYRFPFDLPDIDQDGIFGPQTEEALEAAQVEAEVGADGIYGPDTRDAFSWAYGPDGLCAKLAE